MSLIALISSELNFSCRVQRSEAGNVFAFVSDISLAKGAASSIVKLIDQAPDIDAESPAGEKVNPENVKG
jgi:ATP-binding cassette, subfamily B (MDR/TAP), member 1